MAYSVQKSTVVKVAGLSLVMLLAACSSDQRYKRQVSGDESYLKAADLSDLQAPPVWCCRCRMATLRSPR